jgi:hypothetical protein
MPGVLPANFFFRFDLYWITELAALAHLWNLSQLRRIWCPLNPLKGTKKLSNEV